MRYGSEIIEQQRGAPMLIIPGDIAGPLWIKLLIAGLTLAFLIPAMWKVWKDWRSDR
jgi:hypothetical protein